MSQFFADYALFAAKAVTLCLAVLAVVLVSIGAASRARPRGRGRLQIRKLNTRYQEMSRLVRHAVLSRRELRRSLRAEHKLQKQREKQKDKDREREHANRGAGGTDTSADATKPSPRVFVMTFDGDLRASAVAALREEITSVAMVAEPGDEVVLRLTSSGGFVHSYGLAASQLARLRERNIRLTVAVDKVAASGGYMMASVADHIIAAPFAVVGSIGVVAQIPNFSRLLKRHDVDMELHTAGQYKRTLTMFGENSDEGRAKFKQDLEDTHILFKDFIKRYRPSLDLERVATGEHWYGTRAIELGLIDELKTSDDYLLTRSETAELYEISYKPPSSLAERLGQQARALWQSAMAR